MIDFPLDDPEKMFAFRANMDKQIEESQKRRLAIEADYMERHVPLHRIGKQSGPFHAASILTWLEIAKQASVPHVSGSELCTFSMRDAEAILDRKTPSKDGQDALEKALSYARSGGFWRTDLCASEYVKWMMSEDVPLDDIIPFHLDDARIFDLHWGMPTLTVVSRPRVKPKLVNGYPAEFRVFLGGKAEENAVSWYYPQAGVFEPDDNLQQAMFRSLVCGIRLNETRQKLGLIPWMPESGEPSEAIGCTIDFMLLDDNNLVMIDAGPGFGFGAHPCCFIDRPVGGFKWRLDEGVQLR